MFNVGQVRYLLYRIHTPTEEIYMPAVYLIDNLIFGYFFSLYIYMKC